MMERVSRRDLLLGATAAALLPLANCSDSGPLKGPRLAEHRLSATPSPLSANETQLSLQAGAPASPLFTYGPRFGPVLRADKGANLAIDFTNALQGRHTSVHWHGLRIVNAMDGVPYLTQPPVQPGTQFRYAYAPPDAGTYFFHPHCETVEQLGRGLVGVIIIDGDARDAYDDDLILIHKDWRLGDGGAFLPELTNEGAAKSGTFGTLRTINGIAAPHFEVPSNAMIRLRIINADNTRIPNFGFIGAKGALIAREGQAVAPRPFDTLRVGPSMRIDLAMMTPARGESFQLVDYFAAAPVVLAGFTAKGAPRRKGNFIPQSLIFNALPEPDLDKAIRIQWALGAASGPSIPDVPVSTDETFRAADALCLAPRTFWAISGQSWPQQGHQALPPPLAQFPLGASIVIELFNTTPRVHPIHLHGHSFKVISASRSELIPYWTDTVLVTPNERVQIAFVADNPGDWMVHCHIIEHQETGMMGWFRVA